MYGVGLWSRDKGRGGWPLGGAKKWEKNTKMAIAPQRSILVTWKLACGFFVQGAAIVYEDI